MSKLTHFVTYNNLVPITISVVLLGSSATYAYNNPEVVYDRSERVVSIDNTFIAAVDFDTFSPSVEILSVEEDDETYYVSYRFTTIALVDSVWQNVVSDEELVIPKANLGAYRDLGLYVTEELRELVLAEEKRLRDTQVFEKQNVTRKQLAIEYSGIIGGRLSPEVQTIDGYDPQVVAPSPNPERQNLAGPDSRSTVSKPIAVSTPPAAEPPRTLPAEPVADVPVVPSDTDTAATSSNPATPSTSTPTPAAPSTTTPTTTPSNNSGGGGSSAGSGGGSGTSGEGSASTPVSTSTVPSVTLLGAAAIELEVGAAYTELGVVTTDSSDGELTTQVLVDGVVVSNVVLDTSAVGEYEITYIVNNQTGGTATVSRTVTVVEPETAPIPEDLTPTQPATSSAPTPVPPAPAATSIPTPSAPATALEPEPEPAPEPEPEPAPPVTQPELEPEPAPATVPEPEPATAPAASE